MYGLVIFLKDIQDFTNIDFYNYKQVESKNILFGILKVNETISNYLYMLS